MCVCCNEVWKKDKKEQGYGINRHRPRHGHKYTKYKKCISMMMFIYVKQHLSNIWSSVHEKVKQNWGWVKIKCCLKKACMLLIRYKSNL